MISSSVKPAAARPSHWSCRHAWLGRRAGRAAAAVRAADRCSPCWPGALLLLLLLLLCLLLELLQRLRRRAARPAARRTARPCWGRSRADTRAPAPCAAAALPAAGLRRARRLVRRGEERRGRQLARVVGGKRELLGRDDRLAGHVLVGLVGQGSSLHAVLELLARLEHGLQLAHAVLGDLRGARLLRGRARGRARLRVTDSSRRPNTRHTIRTAASTSISVKPRSPRRSLGANVRAPRCGPRR